jgi:RimJ/RimL family protein N-acetyltransferase
MPSVVLNVPGTPILTERLVLHRLQAEHAAAMWEVLSDAAIYQWMRQEPPRHIAYLEARFRVIEGGRSRDGREQWLNWTAWERTTNAAVGLVEATANEDKCVAIAYMVRPSLWRQGFGCEAVSA